MMDKFIIKFLIINFVIFFNSYILFGNILINNKSNNDCFETPNYPNNVIESFYKKEALNPIVIRKDPYIKNKKRITLPPESDYDNYYCGIKYLDEFKISYELKSYKNKSNLISDGYTITHKGKCGACSTLKDLSV